MSSLSIGSKDRAAALIKDIMDYSLASIMTMIPDADRFHAPVQNRRHCPDRCRAMTSPNKN